MLDMDYERERNALIEMAALHADKMMGARPKQRAGRVYEMEIDLFRHKWNRIYHDKMRDMTEEHGILPKGFHLACAWIADHGRKMP